MDPVTIALGLIQGLPAMLSAINALRATLSANDQATIDAALAVAMSQAGIDIAKAESDLQAASKV